MNNSDETAPVSDDAPVAAAAEASAIDLDEINADLDGVEAALQRLDDGSYWTDEATGQPISNDLLASDPTRRSA